MEAEAAKAAAEAEAAAAPTEKDMINDIRENRRRERRQVTLPPIFSMFRILLLYSIFFILHFFIIEYKKLLQF